MPGRSGLVKQELVVTRIASRLGVKHETIFHRLRELRDARRAGEQARAKAAAAAAEPPRSARPATEEREVLEVLLADPGLVKVARVEVTAEDVRHPGLRRLLEGLYSLYDAGDVPDLDALRPRLSDNPALARSARDLQEVGDTHGDRPAWLRRIIQTF